MKHALSTATAIVVLLHALLGCCAHHAHACVEAGKTRVEHACHTHDHGAPEPAGDHGGHNHNCDGNACVYVRAEKAHVSAELASSPLHFAGLTEQRPTPAGTESWVHVVGLHEFSSPLRLHLLHQVLLI
jgi:hypothetical protein